MSTYKTLVRGKCPICGKEWELIVSTDGYLAWKNGALIQQALPDMSNNEREMLISGMHGDCYDSLCTDIGDAEDACAMY